MTDQKTNEPFETRFADLARAYTDPAGARDDRCARGLARRDGVRAGDRLVDASPGRRRRSVGASMAGAGRQPPWPWSSSVSSGSRVWSRPSNSGIGPQPIAVGLVGAQPRRIGGRAGPRDPSPSVAAAAADRARTGLGDRVPRPDGRASWASGRTDAAQRRIRPSRPPGPTRSWSPPPPTRSGCAVGDLGVYRFAWRGRTPFMTLTAVGTDACATREAALAGPWVAGGPAPAAGRRRCCRRGRTRRRGSTRSATTRRPAVCRTRCRTGGRSRRIAPTDFVLHRLSGAAAEPACDRHVHR